MDKKGGRRYGRRLIICVLAIGCVVCLSSCSVKKLSSQKLRDVDFTVVDEADIPEELMAEIKTAKNDQMKLSYADAGYLYAARGYGRQDSTGYSITVDACYETETAVCVETTLLGPEKGEKILEEQTYPYVVIKMEYTEKQVTFD